MFLPPPLPPSLLPFLPFHCSTLVFHKLISLISVFFTACSSISVSSSPLLVYSSFPRTLSFPAIALGIRLLSARYILHTYVAQDAWWAFLCFLSLIHGWQSHLMPGRHRSRRTHDLQRAESLSGLQDTGCFHS